MRPETSLSPPVKYFSKAVLLLWIIYVISVLFLLCFRECLFIDALWSPAGKGLTSWLSFGKLSLSHWYPGSGVVLDCTDSWSLPFFLLWSGGWSSTKLWHSDSASNEEQPELPDWREIIRQEVAAYIEVTGRFSEEIPDRPLQILDPSIHTFYF